VEVDGHYPYFDYSYHTSKVQIGQIDDMIIDSLPRKRMEIKGVDWMYGAPEYWIEGIGSTLGFLSSGITGIGIFDICYPTLLCLEQDSVITYQDPVVKKCYQKCKPGATGEVPIPEKGKIYPNPASSATCLESADIIEEYSISTIRGLPIVYERCGAHKVTANVADLQNGIYFITIMTKDGISVQKLVIVR